MDRLNSTLLIGLGFVLGVFVALALAPYMLDVSVVDQVHSISGLKQGVGDIAGGILGGAVAFGSAYWVWWLTHKKEEKHFLERKRLAADALLREFGPTQNAVQMMEGIVTSTQEPDSEVVADAYQTFVPALIGTLNKLREFEPDSALGDTIIPKYLTVRSELEAHFLQLIPDWGHVIRGSPKLASMLVEKVKQLRAECDSLLEMLHVVVKLPDYKK